MKRWLCLLLICVMFLSACSAKPNSNKETKDHPDEDILSEELELEEPNATLVVCGKEIEGDYYARIDYEAKTEEFPLVVVAQAMGAIVKPRLPWIIDLVFEDTTYRLNLQKETLIDLSRGENILSISPGNTHPGKKVVLKDDIIVNTSIAIWFLQLREIIIHVDYENAVIYMNPREISF